MHMSKTIVTVGLDLSTKTGVAIYVPGVEAQVRYCIAPKTTGMQRVYDIAQGILSALCEQDDPFIAVEKLIVGHHSSVATLSEINSVVRFLLWQEKYRFIEVSPPTLKKYLTGSGNAKKDQMAMHVLKQYGVETSNSDEADAVALSRFAYAYLAAPGSTDPHGVAADFRKKQCS